MRCLSRSGWRRTCAATRTAWTQLRSLRAGDDAGQGRRVPLAATSGRDTVAFNRSTIACSVIPALPHALDAASGRCGDLGAPAELDTGRAFRYEAATLRGLRDELARPSSP